MTKYAIWKRYRDGGGAPLEPELFSQVAVIEATGANAAIRQHVNNEIAAREEGDIDVYLAIPVRSQTRMTVGAERPQLRITFEPEKKRQAQTSTAPAAPAAPADSEAEGAFK